MRMSRVLAILGVVCVLVVAFAWLDGGREPVREIVQPIATPGQTQ